MKRIITILLSLLLVAGLITGCAKNNTGNGGTKNETGSGKTESDTSSESSEESVQESKDSVEPSEKKTVKIAYLPITHALPVFNEKELLEKGDSNIQIELVKYGSWPELLDALNTNRVDGASVLMELAMKSKEQGVGLKAVALGHRDGNVIMVAYDINSAKDLKGKKFAIPHRQSSHNILLNDMLEKEGMTVDDLEVVELAPPEMPSALATGQIAGYCVAEPFGAKAVTLGVGKALYESGELWEDSLCCGLVLTDKFLNDDKETADKVISSYKEAGDELKTEEAERIAEEYLGQEKEVLDISLKWISFDNLDITSETYNTLTDKIKKYGLSDNPPSFEDFVYQP